MTKMYFFEVNIDGESRYADGLFTTLEKAQETGEEYCKRYHLGDGEYRWVRNNAGTDWWLEFGSVSVMISEKVVDDWEEFESIDF